MDLRGKAFVMFWKQCNSQGHSKCLTYPQISVALTLHQRQFFIVVHRDYHRNPNVSKYTEQLIMGCQCPIGMCTPQLPHLRLREHTRRGRPETVRDGCYKIVSSICDRELYSWNINSSFSNFFFLLTISNQGKWSCSFNTLFWKLFSLIYSSIICWKHLKQLIQVPFFPIYCKAHLFSIYQ